MNEQSLYGSICLSDIPKELIKKGANGKMYLNVYVNALRPEKVKTTQDQNGRTHVETHYIKCAVKKENQVDGVNYFIGHLETLNMQPPTITPQDIANAPTASSQDVEELPF